MSSSAEITGLRPDDSPFHPGERRVMILLFEGGATRFCRIAWVEDDERLGAGRLDFALVEQPASQGVILAQRL